MANQTEETVIDEKIIWDIFIDMVCALKHVHDLGFIHLDVKPENFFVKQNGTVKLGDFGMAQHLNKLEGLCDEDVEGDCIFLAPEILEFSDKMEDKITQKTDIFSLGVTLIEIAGSVNMP